MRGCKMAVERVLIDPHLFHVYEAWVKYILGVSVFLATFLGAACIGHSLHNWSSRVHIVSRQADSSYNQQHH